MTTRGKIVCSSDIGLAQYQLCQGNNMFSLTDEQRKQVSEWWKNHKCYKRYAGAIGGSMTYCFTPTGLGVVEIVKCSFPDCNEELNLTNYDDW